VKLIWLLVVSLFAGSASAQSRQMWFSTGWSPISSGDIGTDQLTGGAAHDLELKGGYMLAVRFGLDQGNHIGHEIQYLNSRTKVQYNYQGASLGGAINQGGYNFIGYLNGKESVVRLFGTIGAHLTNFARPSASALGCESANCTVASQPPTTAGNSKFGFNYGAGTKIKIKSRYGVRLDVRQYMNSKPFDLPLAATGLLRQTEISAGFGVSF
jgi:Outer membrane protein beta-barrel domain